MNNPGQVAAALSRKAEEAEQRQREAEGHAENIAGTLDALVIADDLGLLEVAANGALAAAESTGSAFLSAAQGAGEIVVGVGKAVGEVLGAIGDLG